MAVVRSLHWHRPRFGQLVHVRVRPPDQVPRAGKFEPFAEALLEAVAQPQFRLNRINELAWLCNAL